MIFTSEKVDVLSEKHDLNIVRFLLCSLICIFNFVVIYVRWKRIKPVTLHKLNMLALVATNITCCISIIIVTALQTDLLSSPIDASKAIGVYCSDAAADERNETESSVYINATWYYMAEKNLCYYQDHPAFYLVNLNGQIYLGNYVSTPVIIHNRILRSCVVVCSMVKVVRLRFANKVSLSPRGIWSDNVVSKVAVNFVVVTIVTITLCAILFSPRFYSFDKECLLNLYVSFMIFIFGIPFVLQLIALVLAISIVKDKYSSRDELLNSTPQSSFSLKYKAIEKKQEELEPKGDSWYGVSSSLSRLPTASTLNMVPPETKLPVQQEKRGRGVSWHNWPKRVQEMVATFLFITGFFVVVHVVVAVVACVIYRDFPFNNIKWVIFFVDICVPFYCGEDFFSSFFIRSRRRIYADELGRCCVEDVQSGARCCGDVADRSGSRCCGEAVQSGARCCGDGADQSGARCCGDVADSGAATRCEDGE